MLLEASTELSNGWTANGEELNDFILVPQAATRKDLFNSVCGLKMTKSRARNILEELQFIHVNDKDKNFEEGEDCENGRVWRAISSPSTNSDSKAAIRAKLSVASAHVLLHENRQVWRVPLSVAGSLWNQVHHVFGDYDFRECRNFFSHAFLREKYGSDLRYYHAIRALYISCVPILEVLVEKLEAALADENSWKAEESALSYSDRPEYGMDTPEAEAEAEEQRQIEANEALLATQNLGCFTEEESPESLDSLVDQDSIAENPIAAWLAKTGEWNPSYDIKRRQSWSHFYYVDIIDDDDIDDTDGKRWM
ncbi:hypothetical protein DPSP01_008081 [Paraphaeosphaeria sporulosa]